MLVCTFSRPQNTQNGAHTHLGLFGCCCCSCCCNRSNKCLLSCKNSRSRRLCLRGRGRLQHRPQTLSQCNLKSHRKMSPTHFALCFLTHTHTKIQRERKGKSWKEEGQRQTNDLRDFAEMTFGSTCDRQFSSQDRGSNNSNNSNK